ncbi:nucleotidyltransferase [Thermosipho ferrireducens]|uniref:tRNA(Met) cytidine acetate ligase n=1 Tax=Thermosipho ferrireducens TaxID=2571116 RepID=A0ABX7S8E7_9BACT|nr:nucleotidyltransferase [Thermosipho ferrireducens]QTA38075.1 nucleotidyltransferase [Thermosipho ferrireducens]
MKVLGIIVEYNPMHNGHLYHLQKAKELIDPDYTIAVMSGNFCQRGEPAIINKFARARMALKHGIDIVFELPTIYAIQDAGGFAYGAIGVLHKTNTVTDIVFGSESADINFLEKVALLLHNQPEGFGQLLKKELKKGLSYPNARKYALKNFLTSSSDEIKKLEKSNDILGIEYIRAIFKYKSKIKYHVIKRIGSNYNDPAFKGKFSSATAIRRLIKEKKDISQTLPEKNLKILENEIANGRGPVFLEDLTCFVIPLFRKMRREDFEKIYGFNEGLDLRFFKYSRECGTLQSLIESIKAKRFTYSRIRRLILMTMLNIEKEFAELSNKYGPQYLRVLGFTKKGQVLLSKIKKRTFIPIITTVSLKEKVLQKVRNDMEKNKRNWDIVPELYTRQLELDILSSDIYTYFYKSEDQRKSGMDFRKPIIEG